MESPRTGIRAAHYSIIRHNSTVWPIESAEKRIFKLPSPFGRGAGGEGIEKLNCPHPNPLPEGEGTNPVFTAVSDPIA